MTGESKLNAGLSQVALLHRTSTIVSSGLTLDQMLQELIAITVEVTHCDSCLVYLRHSTTGEIILRASQLPHATEIGNVRMKVGEGVTGWVAEHNSVVALPQNACNDPRFKSFSSLIEDTFEAFLSVPLVTGGEVIGIINVHHKERHAHTAGEIVLLTFVGEQMGGAIAMSRLTEENTRLQGEAIEMRRELETRKLVERAKGVLQRLYNLTEPEAYQRLRNESRRLRRPIHEIAEAVLLVDGLSRGEA